MTRLAEQQARVIACDADLICLQETAPATAESWRLRLAAAGWKHCAVAPSAPALAAARKRPLMALIAARAPIERVEIADLPWPERVVVARVEGLELTNVHSPTSPKPGLAKVLTHERIASYLAGGTGPRVLCGDLNTPRKEHADGRIWTFARDRYGRLRPERGERWDRAELALIKGLERHGFRDALRSTWEPGHREFSWEWPRWEGGYRLDHLIVSTDVEVSGARYLHEWRAEGLSDHSPIYAGLAWAGGSRSPTDCGAEAS